MDRGRAAAALIALAACLTVSDAAPATNQTALDLYDGTMEGCYYNFQHYREGDRIMTNEPCLNCTCHNRMLMCYLKVCPFTKAIGQDCTVEKRADQCCPIVTCPDVPVDLLTSTSTSSPSEYGGTGVGKVDNYGCTINGKYLPEGSKVPPTPNKPCEHCYCIRNMTTCVMQECTLHVDGCTPIYHKDVCCPIRYFCDHPEDEIPLLDDMTTTVRPTPGFILTTTTTEEPTTQLSTKKCVDHDHLYSDGALIRSDKPCVHCYCMKGDIVCVVQECGAPMENEGKNCTSLPPREGHCCPDTYICEGDELSTEHVSDLMDDITTLEPPRRVNMEGSGYRVESDTTQLPESFEPEGSGDESTTPKSTESSEVFTTIPPSKVELDNKFSPVETETEHQPISTEASLFDSSKDITTEPDRGLNTIEDETTEQFIFDKTTEKQDNVELPVMGKTTIAIDTKTTNLPYEENTSVPEVTVPSVSDTTTKRGELITELYEESSTHNVIESDLTTPTFVTEAAKMTPPTDQNLIEEGSGQATEEQYDTTTHHFDIQKPDEASSPAIYIEDGITHHTTYAKETTTEKMVQATETATTSSPEEISTSQPGLSSSTESQIPLSTQTGMIDETNTKISVEKSQTSPYEETTEKDNRLTTVLPELIHFTKSEPTQPKEKDMTTPVTTVRDDILPTEESTQKIDGKFTTNLPELAHSTEPVHQLSSTLSEDIDIISTTLAQDKPELTETTTFNPDDNEIMEEIIPPGRIPGEGDCLQNSITYANESSVPSLNKCQISCKCVSSIIKCDPIICMPQPENMGECHNIYDSPESCCPTYVCDHSKDTSLPESHSHMSGTETSILSTPDCQGDDCQLKDGKSPTTTSIPVYEAPIHSVECSDGKCSLPPVEDEQHIIPTIQDIVPPRKDCGGGQCELPPIEDHTTSPGPVISPDKDCSNGKCDLPPSEDHTTPAGPSTLHSQSDCSDGKCDVSSTDVSLPDCSDGKCVPPIDEQDVTTPPSQDIKPPREDCSGGKCELPSTDISKPDCSDGKCVPPIDDQDTTTPSGQDIEPLAQDCGDGKCVTPSDDQHPSTPSGQDIEAQVQDCSGGQCELPSTDIQSPDCSDGKCITPSIDGQHTTTPPGQDIESPTQECSGGQCELPSTHTSKPDCSDGKCVPPIDDQHTTTQPGKDSEPPAQDCSDGKCVPPIDDQHVTTPSGQDIEPPREDCSDGKCELPSTDISKPDCSDGKCVPPIDDQDATTPSGQVIEPSGQDCNGGQCELPSTDIKSTDCSDGKCTPLSLDDEHATAQPDQDNEPPREDCSDGKCVPPIDDQDATTPPGQDIETPHEDCSDGKCVPQINDQDATSPSGQDIEPPAQDCSDGKCVPPIDDQHVTTPSGQDIEPPAQDCSDGKCVAPIDDQHVTTPSDQDIEPPAQDCSDGKCVPPIDDQHVTTPSGQDIEPPAQDCSNGKCELPATDVVKTDCSDGKCVPPNDDQDTTTPSGQDIEPPAQDCSNGKCELPATDVVKTDCSDGKCVPPNDDQDTTTPSGQDIEPPAQDCGGGTCVPPIDDQHVTTPSGQDIEPPAQDCSDGKCELPSTDVAKPDCSDGKCVPPINDQDATTPSEQDIKPPAQDCSDGICVPPIDDQHVTTPSGQDIEPPREDCSDGKCELPSTDISKPDCSDGKCITPIDDQHITTPSGQDIEPPREDCSDGKCELPSTDIQSLDCSDAKCVPPVDDQHITTPSGQEIEPSSQDCSGGQCELPSTDIKSTDCSDGKCTPPSFDDQQATTPSSQDIKPPAQDCSDGKCVPPIDDQHVTTPSSQDFEPPRKDCSDGKCELPSTDISNLDCSDGKCVPPIDDQDTTTPSGQDIEPQDQDCSDGKCVPPSDDQSPSTPSGQEIKPQVQDCSGGQCELPSTDIQSPECIDGKCIPPSIDDQHTTTQSGQDIESPTQECSGGQCELPSTDILSLDCSDGKCVTPIDKQYATTQSDQDIETPAQECSDGKCDLLPPIKQETGPPLKDCSGGQCDLPPVKDYTTPTNFNTLQPEKSPSIVPTEIPNESCVGDNCASVNEICTDDNCRRTEISEVGASPSCKGPECLLNTEKPTVSKETQEPSDENISMSTETVDHDLHVTVMETAQPETEKPFKSSDLPGSNTEIFTTNTFEEPTTQSMETITRYPQPEVITHKKDSVTQITEPTTNVIESENLPKTTSADETSTVLSIDQEQSTESHKSTYLPSSVSDIHYPELSTPKTLYEIEATSIPIVTTENIPFDSVTEQQNTEIPDILTTKILDESQDTPTTQRDVYPTEKTHLITSMPELIETESPLSQFTLQHDISTTPANLQGEPQSTEPIPEISSQKDKTTVPSKIPLIEEIATSPAMDITKEPSAINTELPDITKQPSEVYTEQPDITKQPSDVNTEQPDVTKQPSEINVDQPDITEQPNEIDTQKPDITKQPSEIETEKPDITKKPSEIYTEQPDITKQPSDVHTEQPDITKQPSEIDTEKPDITKQPSEIYTEQPDITKQPSEIETEKPDITKEPSEIYTEQPDITKQPSELYTEQPAVTKQPSEIEIGKPDITIQPSEITTEQPDLTYQSNEIETEKPGITKQPDEIETEKPSITKETSEIDTEEPDSIKQPDEIETEKPDITKQPSEMNTEQSIIDKIPSTEAAYDKTTKHYEDFSETTPYLVELEEHPHKIDEVSSPMPDEPTTIYVSLEDKEPEVTDSSSDRIPTTVMPTKVSDLETLKPHDDYATISEIPVTTELVPKETQSAGLDNRTGSNTTPVPIQTLDDSELTTHGTVKPIYSDEVTDNAHFTSQTTISTTAGKFENDIATQSPNLDDKFGDDKPGVTTSASPTDISKPFDETLPTDDSLPTEEGQFPPSGGYGQEPDYSDEDQAFGPGTCRYGGKVYVSAQQIPRDDPCDFCFCFRSDIICLQQSCPPPIHGCHEEPIQGFCCPRYECPVSMATALNLTTTTTTTTTTLPPHFLPHAYKGAAQRKGCQIKGHTYKVGEVVRASSGPCLHCTCGGDGQMKCDPKVCTPEPMLRQMIAAAVSAKRRR